MCIVFVVFVAFVACIEGYENFFFTGEIK